MLSRRLVNNSTLLLNRLIGLDEHDLVAERDEYLLTESLGEDVGLLFGALKIRDDDVLVLHFITNVVMTNVDVFCLAVAGVVVGKMNSSRVVAVNLRWICLCK
jgi:hypothetical protein